MTWAVPAALALVAVGVTAGLVATAWRLASLAESAMSAATDSASAAARDCSDAVARISTEAMGCAADAAIGVAEALRPGAAVERAEADLLRDAGPPVETDAMRLRREAVAEEFGAGYDGHVAEGRAAMRLAGLDPDDHAAVADFNARSGAS